MRFKKINFLPVDIEFAVDKNFKSSYFSESDLFLLKKDGKN